MNNNHIYAREFVRSNIEKMTFKEMAQKLNKTENAVKKIAGKMKLSRFPHKNSGTIVMDNNNYTPKTEEGIEMKKEKEILDEGKSWETRQNGKILVNKITKTIVTDLGEFGQVLTSFSTHGAIQRYYVDAYGSKHTAAETAMKFTIFPHAKAVHIYARLHGFSKASPPQTDLEFEEGLTVEDAVKENIQSIKAEVSRKTEIEKYKLMVKKVGMWDNFYHKKFLPMKDWLDENLPEYKLPIFKPNLQPSEIAWVIGFNDWHYRKFCYDHKGRPTYNREIAIKALQKGINSLISQGILLGKPEKIFVTSGGDNLTTDNHNETTTNGTSQVGQVEGIYSLDMGKYVDTTIRTYDTLRQVAPITIVPTFGNHDRETSLMLHILLQHLYKDKENVEVIENHHTRTFIKYGKNGIGFSHGDDMSLAKWKRNAHKLFLVEAREQGINLNVATNFLLFLQHLHTDMYEDLGGVRQYVLPAPPPADSWHNENMFKGNYVGMALHVIDKKEGVKAVIYA